MKRVFISTLVMLTSMNLMAQDLAKYPWLDTSKSFHERAELLCKELTMREKIDQLGNIVSEPIKRNGIVILPSYQYWNEAIYGVARSGAATSFPESKAMSSTWDRQLIYNCASITSDEARRYYLDQNKGLNYWSPTINMARDPRWGREEENYGEDPYLAGELAVPFIRGFQGDNFDGTRDTPYLKLVACAKHFAANNYEQGRQSTTSFVNEKNMREYYLPAFEACVKDAHVKSLMSAYNAFSTDPTEKNPAGNGYVDGKGGLPMSANKMLLTDILRKEWGFDGYVTSDCAAIACIHRATKHLYFGNYTAGTIADGTDFTSIHAPYGSSTEDEIRMEARSTALAIKAGCNTNCEFKSRSSVYQRAGVNATSLDLQGYDNLTEADIDAALIPMLETRFALGEFEKDDCPWNNNVPALETEEHQAMALKAGESAQVTFPVKYDQFSYFNTDSHQFKVEDAQVTLELAASSADVRQTANIHTQGGVSKETYISSPTTEIVTVENSRSLQKTDHIYSVMGSYVCKANDYDKLPSGIYVLNGVKYIKK